MALVKFKNRAGQWVELVIDNLTTESAVQALSAKQGKVLQTNKADKATTLAGYGIADAYTKTEIDALIASVFKYKGVKATYADVEAVQNPSVGDVWFVTADGSEYAWNGTVWEKLGPVIDLSHFLTSLSIAGITLDVSNTTITSAQLIQALNIYTKSEVYNKTEVDTLLAGKVPTSRKVNGHALDQDVTVSKSDVGLGNVDNTPDTDKPVSTAQQTALNGKADKVSNPTDGNLAALESNGNIKDSGKKASDFVASNQGSANAGKALGISNDGTVIPVPFSGEDFTGATEQTGGTHGYVPAPEAGDQDKFLKADGTWGDAPDPTSIINDTAGAGDTNKVWSADKTTSELEKKSNVILKEIQNQSIASFDDGADDLPVRQLKVAIEPVQDLHGYDHPWPAGGKNNLLPNNAVTSTIQGVTYTVNTNKTITANGTSTGWAGLVISTVTLQAGEYVISSGVASGYANLYLELSGASTVNTNNTGGKNTFTLSESGQVTCTLFARPGNAISNVVVSPMIRLASVADETYFPYSNICPITGWDGVQVWDDPVHGGNVEWNQLLDPGVKQFTALANSNNTYYLTGAIDGKHGKKVAWVAGNKYLFLWKQLNTMTSNIRNVAIYNDGTNHYQNFIGADARLNAGVYSWVFTPEKSVENGELGLWVHTPDINVGYTDFCLFNLTQMFGATKAEEIYAMEQANAGSGVAYFRSLFPDDYYPYNLGEITTVSAVNGDPYRHYSITFPSEAGTVYGGTLTIHQDGSGELVVKKKYTLIKNNTWVYEGGHFMLATSDGNVVTLNDGTEVIRAICSAYKSMNQTNGSATSGSIYPQSPFPKRILIRDDSYTDVTSFVSAMGEEQIVYELATPVSYTLTPQQVRTLLGQNNVWADTGDILDLLYYTDNPVSYDLRIMEGATASADGKSGSVPTPHAGDNNKFLRGDGTWGDVPDPQTMEGATAQDDGTGGLVPAPSAGDQDKFLKGDGTWDDAPDPTSIIDDTAGDGDTDKVWSADKTTDELNGKADKVSNATNGNLAELDSNGNLTDSGKSPSDFALANQAIQYATYSNNTISLYRNTDGTGTAAFKFNLPEEMFLDQAHTSFVGNFAWSSTLYPGSTNPNLDGKPVMVLAVKGDATNPNYSFINMTALVDTYQGADASIVVSNYTIGVQIDPTVGNALTLVANKGLRVDISSKADRDTDAVEGNFAEFDANGNPVDSGHKHSDYATKVASPTNGDFAGLDANGNITDSGKKPSDFILASEKGSNSGVATLDSSGKVPSSQLPSSVGSVVKGYYYNGSFYEEAVHTTLITPETDKIYIDLATDHSYYWWGSAYAHIDDPTEIIDDTAGDNDTDKTWSADKLVNEFNGKLDTDAIDDTAGDGNTDKIWSADKLVDEFNTKADKVQNATSGNFAGLDANGNLIDSGSKASDFLTQHQDISGKADKVQNATSGNFAGLDANGNLTDSGKKASDFLTQHQDISGKVDKNQGVGNAGKALGINSQGMVEPVTFSGDDFTGATSSTAGVHGYVPAPAAGDQEKILTGDGTWKTYPGARIITVEGTISNISGAYTGTFNDSRVSADMVPISINVEDSSVFGGSVSVTTGAGFITITCSDVAGESDFAVDLIKADFNGITITTEEFDLLNASKLDKNQGSANAGKALGIDSTGAVVPVPFSGEDFTGATASTAGVHGYVPAPAAGDQSKYLKGDGTWSAVQQRSNADIVDLIYPVGSIYMSVASASPATLFGGTWEQLKDRFLLGAGDTYTAGDTGGSASHTLTTDEMPSHNHTFTGSAVTSSDISANHTHTGTSGNPSANHHHSGPSHVHKIGVSEDGSVINNNIQWASNPGGNTKSFRQNSPYGFSCSNAGSYSSGTGATGNVSAWHTHTTTTGNQSAGHTHSVTAEGSIGNTGSGTAFSIMPPYTVVYMWKRTA